MSKSKRKRTERAQGAQDMQAKGAEEFEGGPDLEFEEKIEAEKKPEPEREPDERFSAGPVTRFEFPQHIVCPECRTFAYATSTRKTEDEAHGVRYVKCPNCGWTGKAMGKPVVGFPPTPTEAVKEKMTANERRAREEKKKIFDSFKEENEKT